jgi:hypothetical protein
LSITHYIQHRVNSLQDLAKTSELYGVEIDIRYHNDEIILHHDAFGHQNQNITLLKDFVAAYKGQGPVILNLKTEGIEKPCIEIMVQQQIKHWFFLDMSMPYFVRFAQLAITGTIPGFTPANLAVRFSEKEPIEYALAFKGQADWLWVDCFTTLPLNASNFATLKGLYKICLVFPELQGHSLDRIQEFKKLLKNLPIDAVCSKRIDLWQK